ncbi:PREDICTED: VITISV_015752 partial [Prunus dulcis]|uniref:PREDICTED: VITISV_015752 partial n=1 Tax=Prunus dulcis TaxID=3755 RepID=A0A5E4FQ53_PRUDU|nr:PREDICTED: VITISV_015752 partial [Prunus dulcis]
MKNIALLGKCLWTFPLVGESLWHAVIRSKYGFEENGRDENSAERGSSWSPWKAILLRNEDLSSLQAILKIQVVVQYDLESQGYSEGRSWKSELPWACISPHWCIKEDGKKVYHVFLHYTVALSLFLKLYREAEVSWAIPKGCHALCEKHVEFGGKKRAKERNRRLFEDNGGMEVEDLWY